jgi:hypothetical protein
LVIFVEASTELRHQRCLRRGRSDRIDTITAFVARDEIQRRMGVDFIHASPTTIKVANETSLEAFEATLLSVTEARART